MNLYHFIKNNSVRTVIFCSLVFCNNIFAGYCPTINDIASGNFSGWLPIRTEDDSPASNAEIKTFQQTIKDFYTAEWSADFNEGLGRCYYNSGVDLALASAKLFLPKPISSNWQIIGDRLRCLSQQVLDCQF